MNVYFRNPNKTLGKIVVDSIDSHQEAIALVKQSLMANSPYTYKMPILAVINGGLK
jgi:hypothetical protein